MSNEGKTCFWKEIKCSENLVIVHKGECGDCTAENLCTSLAGAKRAERRARKLRGMRKRGGREKQVCDQDGNKFENVCKMKIRRCEAAKLGEAIPKFKRKYKLHDNLCPVGKIAEKSACKSVFLTTWHCI